MEYIEYEQYDSPTAYRPARPHPNGWVGNQYTADLIAKQFNVNRAAAQWRQNIANLDLVRLPDSTKAASDTDTKVARQNCYEPVGVPMSVREYVAKVANLPGKKAKGPKTAYADLWWDCQGGHCKGRKGVVGKPYIQFLPPGRAGVGVDGVVGPACGRTVARRLFSSFRRKLESRVVIRHSDNGTRRP